MGGVYHHWVECIVIGQIVQQLSELYNHMLQSLQPLSEEETKKFVILYRIWVRIFFSDYVNESKEVQQIKKFHIAGVYIPLVDLIASKKTVSTNELKQRFYDFDAIVAELKVGYLLEQEGKEYKLNPYFLESIMPVTERILAQLNDEKEQKSQKDGKDNLICYNCKKPLESMYQQIKVARLACTYCHSQDLRKPQVNLDDVKKCDNLIKKIERFLSQKSQIEFSIKQARQDAQRRQKEIIDEKVAKSGLELILEQIPTKKMITDLEEKALAEFYQNKYKPKDQVIEKLKVECSWISRLYKVRQSRG